MEQKKRIIGIDVDGVLADFNNGYRKALARVTGRALIPERFAPKVWYYAQEQYGYTKDEDAATWKDITSNRRFWRDLNALPESSDFLGDLSIGLSCDDEVYFITTRPGLESKKQTEVWLENEGFFEPTVLIARGDKGKIASGLGLTHFIDDKPENCRSVASAVIGCEVFLLDALYNRAAHQDMQDLGIKIVGSLFEFSDPLLTRVRHAAA